jgi:hypothetical protein
MIKNNEQVSIWKEAEAGYLKVLCRQRQERLGEITKATGREAGSPGETEILHTLTTCYPILRNFIDTTLFNTTPQNKAKPVLPLYQCWVVFWVVTPCGVSEDTAASIFTVK